MGDGRASAGVGLASQGVERASEVAGGPMEVVRPRGLWITAVAPLKVVIMVEAGSGGKSSDA